MCSYHFENQKRVYCEEKMADLLKLGFRGYHATVKEFKGEIRIHIRKYVDDERRKYIPTRDGVALTIEEFEELKAIMNDLSEMEDAIYNTVLIKGYPYCKENKADLFKLGSRGYHATVQKFKSGISVHIRKYIDIEGRKNIPTKFGIALMSNEFRDLKKIMNDLNEMLEVVIETNSMNTQPGDDSGCLTDFESTLPIEQETPKSSTQTVNEPPVKKLKMNNDGKVYFTRVF